MMQVLCPQAENIFQNSGNPCERVVHLVGQKTRGRCSENASSGVSNVFRLPRKRLW